MGCGCGGGKKPWPTAATANDKQDDGTPTLRGSAHPNYTWPPRGNGPAAKKT